MQLYWQQFLVDPWWHAGDIALLLPTAGLFLFSFFRHFRTLAWFYIAGIFCASVYFLFLAHLPSLYDFLASYRPDWSLVYLAGNFTFSSILTSFVLYFALYGALGVGTIFSLLTWSFFSFRWKRLQILFSRSIRQSWGVLVFSLLTLGFHRLMALSPDGIYPSILLTSLALLTFLFVFQFFIRLIDSALLSTAKIFLEFSYAIGLLFLLISFLNDWYGLLVSGYLTVQLNFFHHLFLFFFLFLVIGYFSLFSIRAFFISPFYLQRYFHRKGKEDADRKERYARFQLLLGVLVSVGIGMLLFFMNMMGMILPSILVFFAAYFVLFYFLDHQEDARIRGDLVEKRVNSGHQRG